MTTQALYAIPSESHFNFTAGKRYRIDPATAEPKWGAILGWEFYLADDTGWQCLVIEHNCCYGGSWTFAQDTAEMFPLSYVGVTPDAGTKPVENLESHPYRVMFSCTTQLQAGGERKMLRVEHCGFDNLDAAIVSSQALRRLTEQGKGLHYGHVIHASWIEKIERTRLEV